MSQHVLVTLDDGVQVLTLNRTDKKNALTPGMYAALADGLERAEVDPDIRVTLTRMVTQSFQAMM